MYTESVLWLLLLLFNFFLLVFLFYSGEILHTQWHTPTNLQRMIVAIEFWFINFMGYKSDGNQSNGQHNTTDKWWPIKVSWLWCWCWCCCWWRCLGSCCLWIRLKKSIIQVMINELKIEKNLVIFFFIYRWCWCWCWCSWCCGWSWCCVNWRGCGCCWCGAGCSCGIIIGYWWNSRNRCWCLNEKKNKNR